MNLLDPVKWGAQAAFAVTSTAVKIGINTLRTAELLLGRDAEDDAEHRYSPVAAPVGGDGRPAPSRAASPRQARTRSDAIETSAAPPEPTSAAGASGGIAGTAAAPGDAARAGAPDPTAATSTRRRPTAPRGERKPTASAPPAPEERFKRDEDQEEDALVETEGAAAPSATLRIDEPFKGYDKLKAPEIVARVRESGDAVRAVVRLYESTHKKRKSILAATE